MIFLTCITLAAFACICYMFYAMGFEAGENKSGNSEKDF